MNVSIIVPTFQEANNIPGLVKRISAVDFAGHLFEIILVDDNSQDGTIEIVQQLQKKYAWLKLIVRQEKRCLSQSIMDGFKSAQYSILGTMDADLSHPPEKLPEMLAVLSDPTVDLVIGSRYVDGGSLDQQWPLMRKWISRFSAFLAMHLLRLTIKDPLSGFFLIRKSNVFSGAVLQPLGWKFGLEMIVKCGCRNIQEVPIHFSERHQGASKLSYKAAVNYLWHLKRLFFYKLFS